MEVLIGISLIALLVFLLWRGHAAMRVSSAYAAPAKRGRQAGDYHAVYIQFCEEGACPAVRRHRGERMLAKQAPTLPLANCNEAECSCRYAHYDDRRKIMGRRATDNGFDRQSYVGPERRASDDRRNGKGEASEPKTKIDFLLD